MAQALAIARVTGEPSDDWCYIRGYVYDGSIDLETGTATWRLTDDDGMGIRTITVHGALDVNGQRFLAADKVGQRDIVTLRTQLVNHNEHDFCAYIVGWPGTLPAGQTATVTLREHMSGYTYTWQLTADRAINFGAGSYYTIDLRDHEYVKQK